MRYAYADPPYPGCANRYPEKTEVDHADLVARLMDEFPDGWALSTGSVQLREVVALCPRDIRIGAWVKPYVSMRPNVNPFYAWEPLLFTKRNFGKDFAPVSDWLVSPPRPPSDSGLLGSKPDAFFFWMMRLLGVTDGDDLVDVFPGTGRLGEVHKAYISQLNVFERGA